MTMAARMVVAVLVTAVVAQLSGLPLASAVAGSSPIGPGYCCVG